MQPTFYSLNIKKVVSKFPEFLTLQRIVHRVRIHSFIRAILYRQISIFDFIHEEKNLMLKCLVLLLKLFLQFSCSRIVLLLSWYKLFCSTLYPSDSRKIFVYNIRLDASSTPTNHASEMLFVFIFCFHDTYTISTFPIVNVATVWDLKYKHTKNSASK